MSHHPVVVESEPGRLRSVRYAPRDSKDVFEMEGLLCTSMGLPQTVVREIIEQAEYWVRSVASGGNVGISGGCGVTAQVQGPASARP